MMNTILISLVFLVGVLSLQAQSKSDVDNILGRYLERENAPAIAVLVMKDGEVLLKNTHGKANVEKNRTLRSQDPFNLHALSAQFTAVALMKLEHEKVISMQDRLSKYIPSLPPYMQDLTLNQLMLHQSGIPAVDQKAIVEAKGYVDGEAILEALSRETALLFVPGSRMDINPVNYLLLGEVINSLTGSYRNYMQSSIFDPLEMKGAYVQEQKRRFWHPRPVQGYVNTSNQELMRDPLEGKEKLFGIRGVYASLDDYANFLAAYDKEHLLPLSVMSSSFQIRFFQPNLRRYPGKGWYLAFNEGSLYAFQSAAGTGFTHVVLRIPDEKLTVVLLCNQGGVFGLRRTAFEIVNLYTGKSFNPE